MRDISCTYLCHHHYSAFILIQSRWRSAISTLAKLHLIDAKEIGLEDFGRAANFYNRQIKTLSVVSNAQAETIDLKTKKKVGPIPHFGDMVKFFGDPRTQPKDRSSLIHGDYKIDNLVYHTHEPRVVGILEYVDFPNET